MGALTATPVSRGGQDLEPDATNPYDLNVEQNKSAIDELITKRFEIARRHRWRLERDWFYMLLMASGNQWITWDRGRRNYKAKATPSWFPTPITNQLRSHIDANVSAVTRHEPQMSWYPLSLKPDDVASADIANRVNGAIEMETRRRQDAHIVARWSVTTGDCFIESYWDADPKHGTEFIQDERCMDCGKVSSPRDVADAGHVCPECGSDNMQPARAVRCATCPQTGEEFEPGMVGQPSPAVGTIDDQGNSVPDPNAPMLEPVFGEEKLGQHVPKGKIGERVRSPFEVFYDPTIKDFTEDGGRKWCVILELVDRQEMIDQWGEDLVSAIPEGGENSQALSYLNTLSVLTDSYFSVGNQIQSLRGGGGDLGDRVIRETYYQLPDNRYPQGLHATRLNGIGGAVVEGVPLWAHDTDGKEFIPVVQIPFDRQPGRCAGRTTMLDVAKLQDRRNMAEAIMEISGRRMAVPHWLIPMGSQVTDIDGEAGSQILYRPVDAGGTGGRAVKPEIVQPANPAQYWMLYIEHLDAKMEELAGSFGVAHGEAPPGITAASALALLSEKQQNKVAPQVRQWELAWEEVARQQMYIFREYGYAEKIFTKPGSDTQWEQEKFSSADLSGRFNVRVEAGSALPKSTAQMRATIEGLLNLQLLDPSNPTTHRRLHTVFGTRDLIEDIDVDLRDAQRENDRFMRLLTGEPGAQEFMLRPLIDNHQVHMAEHIKMMKGDTFIGLEKAANEKGDIVATFLVQMAYLHLQGHMQIVEQQMMAQQAMQGGGEQPPGQEQKGGGNNENTTGGGGKKQEGPGRPEGSGRKVFGKQKDGPERDTRAVLEPKAPISQ